MYVFEKYFLQWIMCFTLGDLHSKLVSDVLYLERSLVTNSAQLTWIWVLVPAPNLQILTHLVIEIQWIAYTWFFSWSYLFVKPMSNQLLQANDTCTLSKLSYHDFFETFVKSSDLQVLNFPVRIVLHDYVFTKYFSNASKTSVFQSVIYYNIFSVKSLSN